MSGAGFGGGAGLLAGRNVTHDESWIDPLIGAKGRMQLGSSKFYIDGGAGLGGFGVLTVWLNQRYGWLVGRSQLAVDVVVLGLSAAYLAPAQLGWSSLSALVMGIVVYLWHRPGRYTGYSQLRW